jgi:hypothetical protein
VVPLPPLLDPELLPDTGLVDAHWAAQYCVWQLPTASLALVHGAASASGAQLFVAAAS